MRRYWGKVVLLLAYGLRLYRLGLKDFWWDEAHSWALSTRPLLQGVTEGLATHNHFDPLFLIILHFWSGLVGQTEFTLRYLSALLGVLTVAYLARAAWRGFGSRVGAIALGLGAVAPVWVFFSQEVRQYAILPILMLIMFDATLDLSHRDDMWAWVRLSAAEALGLYTHSFMIFGLFGVQLLVGMLWLRKRIRLKVWMLSQVVVLILAIPMFQSNLARATGAYSAPTLGVAHLVNALWNFWMGVPWAEAERAGMPLRILSWGILVMVGMGLAIALRRADGRRRAADVFWLVSFTIAATVLFWQVNNKIHPRYLLILSGPLFVLIAWVIGSLWEGRGRSLSIGLVVVWLAAAAVGLHDLYVGAYPGYRHDQTRALTTYLRETLGPEDGIVSIDPRDNGLVYYDVGHAEVFFAGIAEGVHTPEEMIAFVEGREQIAVVKFHVARGQTDLIASFYLERYGRYLGSQGFEGYEVRLYQMAAAAAPEVVDLTPVDANFGLARIDGVSAMGGDAPTVALRWRVADESASLAAVVRLIDSETGWEIARGARALSGASEEIQFFVLPVPPGTPPIPFDLQVSLIRDDTARPVDFLGETGTPSGQWATLAHITPQPCTDDPYGVRSRLGLREVIEGPVSAYAVDWPSTTPGGRVGLTLEWRELPVGGVPIIRLTQGEQIVAEDHGPPPLGRATPDFLPFLDRRVLAVSAEAAPGSPTDIEILVGDEIVTLGQLPVIGFVRIYEPPAAAHPLDVRFGEDYLLVGYDLESEQVSNDGEVRLTLYWQALTDGSPGHDFTVFTHILDEGGRLIGQHDGAPVYSTRPTSGWLAGEYIVDEHIMAFRELYAGEATIQVGLYDPATFERLLTSDGADAVRLPVSLEVTQGYEEE